MTARRERSTRPGRFTVPGRLPGKRVLRQLRRAPGSAARSRSARTRPRRLWAGRRRFSGRRWLSSCAGGTPRSRSTSTVRTAQAACSTSSRQLRLAGRRDAHDAEAKPDDGLFDVLLIGDVTKLDLVLTLPKIYRGTPPSASEGGAARGRPVRWTPTTPLPIELDGEQPGTTPVTFEVVPHALRLRVPA